jgi:chemotaxis protein CheD
MTAPSVASRRYFDQRFSATLIAVAPGDHGIASSSDDMLTTLLGSCVAACILDPEQGLGGMNHFLLPRSPKLLSGERDLTSLAYGDHAMEVLITALLKAGARRSALKAKVFGGANMHASMESFEVGKRNIRFVEEFLQREGIAITARDVGGTSARRIVFHPATGKAHVNQLNAQQAHAVVNKEVAYEGMAAKRPRATLEMF